MTNLHKAALAVCIQSALFSHALNAQEAPAAKDKGLEKITVTAQKRTKAFFLVVTIFSPLPYVFLAYTPNRLTAELPHVFIFVVWVTLISI